MPEAPFLTGTVTVGSGRAVASSGDADPFSSSAEKRTRPGAGPPDSGQGCLYGNPRRL